DWSWNANIADFDNDGSRDIFITNGYPRDVTDHDFGAFRSRSANIASKKELIAQIPQIRINNYAYRNIGDARFENKTKDWGLDQPSFSSGAVYVDLDNDGDLDYVINNINDPAFVYENTINTKEKISANFLKIRFNGEQKNRNGLGAIATIYYDHGKKQVWENSPYRGYLSCVEQTVLFGLGKSIQVDSMTIKWNSGKMQLLRNISANQVVEVNEKNAMSVALSAKVLLASNSLFTDVTSKYKVNYQHHEADYIDFNAQRLLPHKLSEYGPGLAVGDIDGNGLDDICIGGTGDYQVSFLMQQADSAFIEKKLPFLNQRDARRPENIGILLFDADGDGDPDLYLTSGSSEFDAGSKNFQDRFFENDGKGNFSFRDSVLPKNFTSKSCVKAADIDNDGDLDLFVGGRVLPGRYPEAVSSFLYRNDSKNGQIRFTDISSEIAPELKDIGLVCDALFTDYDNDGSIDLVITGEWMSIQVFKNVGGKYKNITAATGIDGYKGWWNSIAAGDFDNDGDIDYVAGNLGANSYYRANKAYPVRIYGGDFAQNKTYVGISSLYLPDMHGQKKEFPAQNRDDVIDQLPALKKKFLTYKSFAEAGMDQMLDAKDIQAAYRLEANFFSSAYIENLGNGKFAMHELPWLAQMAPVYGMVTDDVNGDGNLDLVLVGNDFGTEVAVGRYDALNGLVLLGDGLGNFKPQSITEGGLFVPGNAKALVKLSGAANSYLLAASQNKGALKIFKKSKATELVKLADDDKFALFHLKNGKTRKEEIYHGSSFVSQSSSFLLLDNNISSIDIIGGDNHKRTIISSSAKNNHDK
ncbi:MAG: VCBS repeat-containing protein, partial [Flavitalea sp.]